MVVGEEEYVGRTVFLPALIPNAFSTPQSWGVGAVNMGKRQVNVLPIEDEDICVCLPPLILSTPFPVALEHGVLGWKGSAKKMAQIDQTPLASALALVEYGVDHLKKIKFRYKFSFCDER